MMHLNHKKLDALFWGIPGAPQPLHEKTDWGEEHCDSTGSIIGTVSRVIMIILIIGETKKDKRKNLSI